MILHHAANPIDPILAVSAIAFLWRGARTGLLRSLIVPLSLAGSLLIGVLYFDLASDLRAAIRSSLLIGFLLSILARAALHYGRLHLDESIRTHIPPVSRLSGAVCNLVWNEFLMICALTLFSLLAPPSLSKPLAPALEHSTVMRFVHAHILQETSMGQTLSALAASRKDLELQKRVHRIMNRRGLMESHRLRVLLDDPDFQEAVRAEDTGRILAHPKLAAVLKDPELINEILKAYRDAYGDLSKNESP